jgi:hypothetical protein
MDLKSILSTYTASVRSCNFPKVELKLKSKIQKPVYQSTPARDSSETEMAGALDGCSVWPGPLACESGMEGGRNICNQFYVISRAPDR